MVGGFAEVVQRHTALADLHEKPSAPLRASVLGPALLEHGATLFLCFGAYTFLSTSWSPEKSPPSVPMTFALGALAGAFGVPTVHAIKTRSLQGLGKLAAAGGVRVGTVIGVQVQASAKILEYLQGSRRVQGKSIGT